MKIFSRVAYAVTFAFAIFTADAQADSLRCKGDLALIGDSKASVLHKCGEPMLKDSFCKATEQSIRSQGNGAAGTTVNVTSCDQVDEWSYNPGSGQFITTLRFEQGVLKSIKYGDRIP